MIGLRLSLIGVECGICSGPILNQGKQGRNQGNIRENDFADLEDTLLLVRYIWLKCPYERFKSYKIFFLCSSKYSQSFSFNKFD